MLNKIIKKNLVLIILVCIFIILSLIIKYNYLDYAIKLDKIVKDFFDNKLMINALINSMKIITHVGSFIGILTIFIFSMILFKDKSIKLTLISNISLILILSTLLKRIFSRERPLISLIKMPTSYSYPSGHTFFSVGFIGLVVYFILKSNINKNIKIILVSLISLIIFLIGISRIYLGVHHFTDVVGGLILGLLVLFISMNTYKILKEEL